MSAKKREVLSKLNETINLDLLKKALLHESLYAGLKEHRHIAVRILSQVKSGLANDVLHLAEVLDLVPSEVKSAVDKLVASGLLSLKEGRLELTAKGQEVFTKMAAIHDEISEQIFKDFDSEELDQFLTYLAKIKANLAGISESELAQLKEKMRELPTHPSQFFKR
ncbi:MarR family winged helix-turn-helix transcriptional regulator [Ligilactobacillus agilis]|uniref:MarR family winged helix-turn-helix transcriptional regulator n=1 Tax=Ligilactobacillus agilis TaxID=1601 RepID=UPI001D6B3E7D|nr:hypothetical protein [Ligilactobacillus agilis]HJG05236.1 hypothetical protein [Ligilactobacillus agilis]